MLRSILPLGRLCQLKVTGNEAEKAEALPVPKKAARVGSAKAENKPAKARAAGKSKDVPANSEVEATRTETVAHKGQQLWLIKSEPDEYPIESLQGAPNGQGFWDGEFISVNTGSHA